MKRRMLMVLVTSLVPLLFTGLLLAQSSPWAMSISVDPAVVDLTLGQREVTVTVAISRTESAAENALVICTVQPGEVMSTSPGLYPFGARQCDLGRRCADRSADGLLTDGAARAVAGDVRAVRDH